MNGWRPNSRSSTSPRPMRRLDKVVPKKDSEGYRLDASGRRVTIVFETDQNRQAIVDMLQLAMPMLKRRASTASCA